MTQTLALEGHLSGLEVSQGRHAGEPFTVLPWERRFVRGAFAPGVRSAALAIARGNGKTTLVAGVACAYLDGPMVERRGEVVIVASAFSQARIAFEHVLAFLDPRDDPGRWRIQDSANTATVEDRRTGARVRCIGSDPRRAHGLAPVLVLADEPAQWPHTSRDAMLSALATARGKISGSRLVALGTRPADAEHWFSRMLAGGADYSQQHAARPDDPPFRLRTWRRANPSLDHMPDLLGVIRDEARAAKLDPALLPSFKALRLNMGVADIETAMLLDAATWQRIETPDMPQAGGEYTLALDLGDGAAMSAAAGYWPQTGRLEALAAFPAVPDLAERGLRDGVGRLYRDMATRGELIVTPGRAVSVESLLLEALDRWERPAVIVADRYRETDLRQALDRAGFPQAAFGVRGMGFRDGAEDVRLFRRACLEGKVAPGCSLLLRAALAEARTVADPAGNEKLAKGVEGRRRRRARDDAAAAAILAVAEGVRRGDRPHRSWRYRGMAG